MPQLPGGILNRLPARGRFGLSRGTVGRYDNATTGEHFNKEMTMGKYVDGFVLPVPKRNRARYVRLARLAAKVWRDHGALQYRECIADDVPKGKLTSFPRGVKLKSSEVVWFSFIVYRNRKHRDRVNAKVMKDPRLAKYMNPKAMPLDGKRVIFGGFEVVVDR